MTAPPRLAIIGTDTSPDWYATAACRTVPKDVFYPQQGANTTEALKVCAGCAHRAPCYAWAIQNRERRGVWGGVPFGRKNGTNRGKDRKVSADQLAQARALRDSGESWRYIGVLLGYTGQGIRDAVARSDNGAS